MLNNPLMRYACSILLTITFSLCIPISSILHIPASMIILFTAYQMEHVCFYIGIVAFNIALSRFVKKNRGHILMFLNIAILILFKYFIVNSTMDISGPMMLLAQKGYYLGTVEFSLIEKLKFFFFVPGVLAGPVFPPSLPQTKPNMYKALSMLYQSLPFGIIYVCLFNTRLKNITEVHWVLRIPCLYFYVFVRRCMFYFIWTLMPSCFLMQGYDVKNIFPFRVETAATLKEVTDSWNIYTNMWLKDSIFRPLKKYGYFVASFATFILSALWHGLNPCYLLMFLNLHLASIFARSMNQILNGKKGRYFMIVFLGHFLVFYNYAFLSLDFMDTIKVWRSVGFYGFIQMAIYGGFYGYQKLFCKSSKK